MSNSNPLKALLQKMDGSEADKFVDKLKGENEDTQYADMIRMFLDRVEEHTVIQIKGYGGNDNERLWNAVGRLQAVELIKSLLFTRLADYNNMTEEQEEDM